MGGGGYVINFVNQIDIILWNNPVPRPATLMIAVMIFSLCRNVMI